MTTLYGRRQENITLVQAIADCHKCLNDSVGLLYSPESCLLSQVKGTHVAGSDGKEIHLDRVFEARIFNSHYELRWLNQQGGKGIAVLLSEQEIKDFWTGEIESLQAIDIQDQTYLLWGEGYSASLKSGWSRLATSRLGKLDVPIDGVDQSKQRVKLIAKEYFQRLDHLHGNVVVAEERLVQLLQLPTN
jgi:CRISPR-associated protein (TIGR03984 family)